MELDTNSASKNSQNISEEVKQETQALDNIIFSAETNSKEETNLVDPIIEAIRNEIISKQNLLLQTEVAKNLAPEEKEEFLSKDFNEFRYNLKELPGNKTFEDIAKESNLKNQLHDIEREGYSEIHRRFKNKFYNVAWEGVKENNFRSTRVEDKSGNLICTLNETSFKPKKQTIFLSNGSNHIINKYRTIDFPINLKTGTGPMHASMAAMDINGNNISKKDAVYFTAHYNCEGKIMEISSPTPMKFAGKGDDAVGYIEINNNIFTLPITKGKYRQMTQEIIKNKQQEKTHLLQNEISPSNTHNTEKEPVGFKRNSNAPSGLSEIKEKAEAMKMSRKKRSNEAAEPPERINDITSPPAILLAEKMRKSRQAQGNESAEPASHLSSNQKDPSPSLQIKPLQIPLPNSNKLKKKDTNIKDLLKASQELDSALSNLVEIVRDAKITEENKSLKTPNTHKENETKRRTLNPGKNFRS